ncbi:MAG TPA: PKD domain-containing protein, partial [Burkholderiales bacterium]|nr:PKD domain-containing protein [Burkholderiales bacterium]
NTRIYTLLEGVAPTRRLTIAWVNVQQVFALGEGTFEMTLYESSNDIVFQYQDTTFGGFSYDHGYSAAIGTEDVDAYEGTPYPLLVPEGTALRFYQAPYNYKPVANPGGPYSGVVKQPLAFDGSKSFDQNGDSLSYLWSFGDIYANAVPGTGARPTYTYQYKGRYTATLTVSDGFKQSDPVSVTVDIPNHPPVAKAGGPYAGLGNELIAFNPSGSSDVDGDALTYKWTARDATGQISGTIVGNGGFFLPGTYSLTLVVNDGTADSAPSSTTLSVANQPPTVYFNPPGTTFVYRGRSGELVAMSNDLDGQVVAWAWRQVAGDPISLAVTNQPVLDFFVPKNFKPGNVVFEITVTDNLGAKTSAQATVQVLR